METTKNEGFAIDHKSAIIQIEEGASVGVANSAAADAGFRIDWDSAACSGYGRWAYQLVSVSKRDVAAWKRSAQWPTRKSA